MKFTCSREELKLVYKLPTQTFNPHNVLPFSQDKSVYVSALTMLRKLDGLAIAVVDELNR
jgi:hypothetical protein